MPIQVKIKISGGETFTIEVDLTMTVLDLKEKCSERAGVPADMIRLVFRGRIAKDTDTLEALKMEDGNTVHLVRSGGKPKQDKDTDHEASSTVDAGKPATTADSGTSSQPQQGGPQSGQSNPFNPDFMAQVLQGMPPLTGQNMAALLNMPIIQEVMRQMINNPDLIRELMNNSPIMGPMADNPIFNQMLNNPELMRTMLQTGMLQAGLNVGEATREQQGAQTTNPQNVQQASVPGYPFGPFMGSGGFPGFTLPGSVADNRPPEEKYAFQLQTLLEMGFSDRTENLNVLVATGGDISAAITRLLEARGTPPAG